MMSAGNPDLAILGNNKNLDLHVMKTDAEIWDDFIRGNDDALTFIFNEYVSRLFNYGKQIINDDDVVSDSIQELFYKLVESREKLGKTTSIKNYLYASLRRSLVRIKDKQNKNLPPKDIQGNFQISYLKDEATPFDQFSEEQVKILENACNALPERQREAILLLFYEGMKYEDVARIMKIGQVRSARALVYRAIDTLKDILDPVKHEFLGVFLLILFN